MIDSLASKVVAALKDRNYLLSVAESCTGGMLSSDIVSVSGASKVFDSGFVVYSNDAKINILGIDPDIINRFGAVSKQTAYAMVESLLNMNINVDLAVSITGIAEKTEASYSNKPAGFVCFGYGFRNKAISTVTTQFSENSRNNIRRLSTDYALELILQCIS